jgi:SAM-dependent methyltransferase
MTPMGWLKSHYRDMKASYLDSLEYEVPPRYHSSFVHWGGGVEAQYIFRHLTRHAQPPARVLIVGVMGGRDYYFFENLGYEVKALDIGPQPDIDGITYGNVEDALPYEEASFDIVLMGEVLEHLERDAVALRNVRRVLKDDGYLVVTVPFYNDWEEGHTRIHSPASARRLLALGGFAVVDYIERPGVLRPNPLNPVQHAISLVSYLTRGRTTYAASGELIGRFSVWAGRKRWLLPIRRRSKGYGGYFLCVKGESLDHVGLNRALYTSDS